MSSQVEIDAILAEAEGALSGSTGRETPGPLDGAASAAAAPATDQPPTRPETVASSEIERIMKIAVPVIVRLAHRSMRVKEIMQFATGSIVEFDKPADAELDLMINNEVIGYGQAVKVGENFGLRVLRVRSVREKIEALGGESG